MIRIQQKLNIAPGSWPYILSHPVITVVGAVAVVSGLMIFLAPGDTLNSSSLAMWLPPLWERLWPFFHMVGGITLIYGIVTRKPQWEALGCVFLVSTFFCQCIAVLVIRGFDSGFVASVTLGSLALGLAFRAALLVWANKEGQVS